MSFPRALFLKCSSQLKWGTRANHCYHMWIAPYSLRKKYSKKRRCNCTIHKAGVHVQSSASSQAISPTSGKLKSTGSQLDPSENDRSRAPSFCHPRTNASAVRSLQQSRTASCCSGTMFLSNGCTSLHNITLQYVQRSATLSQQHFHARWKKYPLEKSLPFLNSNYPFPQGPSQRTIYRGNNHFPSPLPAGDRDRLEAAVTAARRWKAQNTLLESCIWVELPRGDILLRRSNGADRGMIAI
jgi:hypothetical protein